MAEHDKMFPVDHAFRDSSIKYANNGWNQISGEGLQSNINNTVHIFNYYFILKIFSRITALAMVALLPLNPSPTPLVMVGYTQKNEVLETSQVLSFF